MSAWQGIASAQRVTDNARRLALVQRRHMVRTGVRLRQGYCVGNAFGPRQIVGRGSVRAYSRVKNGRCGPPFALDRPAARPRGGSVQHRRSRERRARGRNGAVRPRPFDDFWALHVPFLSLMGCLILASFHDNLIYAAVSHASNRAMRRLPRPGVAIHRFVTFAA